jgi:hypothetical protein
VKNTSTTIAQNWVTNFSNNFFKKSFWMVGHN